MKVRLILLICAFVTGIAAKTKTGAGAPETAAPAPSLDEVSDSEGKISKTKVLGIGEKEILIKDPVTGEEKKIPTDNLIFVRLANGKYYFFFPSEPPPQQAPAKTTAAGPAKWEVTAGFAGHFANNDSVADYTGMANTEVELVQDPGVELVAVVVVAPAFGYLGTPMNVSALKAMRAHWGPMMAMLLRVRAGYLRRCPDALAGWTVGHLERLSTAVLTLPT